MRNPLLVNVSISNRLCLAGGRSTTHYIPYKDLQVMPQPRKESDPWNCTTGNAKGLTFSRIYDTKKFESRTHSHPSKHCARSTASASGKKPSATIPNVIPQRAEQSVVNFMMLKSQRDQLRSECALLVKKHTSFPATQMSLNRRERKKDEADCYILKY